jgi:hypothetical protein
MSRLTLIVACLVCATSLGPIANVSAQSALLRVATVEHDDSATRSQEPRAWGVETSAALGLATAPFPDPALREVRGVASVFALRAHLAIDANWLLGVHVPMVSSVMEKPAGSSNTALVLGNIEVSLARRLETPAPDLTTQLQVSIAAPAEGGAAPADNLSQHQALALASALQGLAQQQSFSPGRVPLTAQAGLAYRRRLWRSEAALKIPLLIRAGQADRAAGTEVRPIGLLTVLTLYGAATPWRWLELGMRSWLTTQPVAPVRADGVEPVGAQLGVQPEVHFHVLTRGHLTLLGSIPVFGPLGGEVYAVALNAGVAL